VVKLREHLLGHHDEFMAHVLEPAVPGTNNLAERQIRSAVVARKTGGCNKTVSGALVHRVLASLLATVRQQGKRFLDLALPLWRQAQPAALEIGALPEVVEKGLQGGWPDLAPPGRLAGAPGRQRVAPPPGLGWGGAQADAKTRDGAAFAAAPISPRLLPTSVTMNVFATIWSVPPNRRR
jgi:hypothetical protein